MSYNTFLHIVNANKNTVKGCILKGDTKKVKEIFLVFIKKKMKS